MDGKDIIPYIDPIFRFCYRRLSRRCDAELEQIGFYRCETGMERLGYIFIPYFLRKRIQELKNGRLNLPAGNFPPRKDGGRYPWEYTDRG